MGKASKYQRCPECKELVSNAADCANCRERNPLAYGPRKNYAEGRRGRPTLDIQERNEGFWGDEWSGAE